MFSTKGSNGNPRDQGKSTGAHPDYQDTYLATTKQTETVILTPHQVEEMGGNFEFKRDVIKQIAGEPVQVTQHMFRLDGLGRIVKNDDIAGVSWACPPTAGWAERSRYLIPHDHYGVCANPWNHHEFRLVFLFLDGGITERGNVLCTECFEYLEKLEFWSKWLGFLFNPELP